MTILQRSASLLAAFGLTLLLPPFSSEAFQADDDLPPAEFSVETRGPVHEAFAQPNDGLIEMGAPVPKEPPPMIPERPPEQILDNPNMEWIPGYWAWDADRGDFVWISGTLRNPPPGRRWIPGHWANSDAGWRWVPGLWAPENQPELQYTPEPPAPLEDGPALPAPDADSSYVPGYWSYSAPEQRFAWRPGYWAPFRAGRIWTTPQYTWTPNGYLFVPGYWDYPLDDRGLLFAPAYFPTPLWANAGWFYRPNYVVSINLFFGSGFRRPGWNSFFFGNYYGGNYAGLGFRPWWGGQRNSVYDYYRWQNRGNPGWANQHQQMFNDRMAGRAPLPPSNLAQQRAQFKGKNGPNGDLAAVTPLRSFTPKSGALVRNTNTAVQDLQIQQARDLTKIRRDAETGPKNGGPKFDGLKNAGPGAGPAGFNKERPTQATSLKLPPNAPRVRPPGTPAPSLSDSKFPGGIGNGQNPNLNPAVKLPSIVGKTAPPVNPAGPGQVGNGPPASNRPFVGGGPGAGRPDGNGPIGNRPDGNAPAGAAKLPFGNPYAAPNGSGAGPAPKQFGPEGPQMPRNPNPTKGPANLPPSQANPRFGQNPQAAPPASAIPRPAPTPPVGNLPRSANPPPAAVPPGQSQIPNRPPVNPAPRPNLAPVPPNIPRSAPPPSAPSPAPRMAAPAPTQAPPRSSPPPQAPRPAPQAQPQPQRPAPQAPRPAPSPALQAPRPAPQAQPQRPAPQAPRSAPSPAPQAPRPAPQAPRPAPQAARPSPPPQAPRPGPPGGGGPRGGPKR